MFGVLVAYPLGMALERAITGELPHSAMEHKAATYAGVLLLSLAVVVSTTYFFYSRERMAATHEWRKTFVGAQVQA